MTGTVVASFYMENIPAEVVRSQAAVLRSFASPDVTLTQILTSRTHAEALDDFMEGEAHGLVVFLDIDCVPLNAGAIPTLVARAAEGSLAGCVQRANHIGNRCHLYIGPFCMALTRRLWEELGRPSFQPTERGDAGEELTYRCEELGRPLHMLWPSAVETPLWELSEGRQFGLHTEYDAAFLHTFCIRDPKNQRRFVERCRGILG
jgi:hypothetical protein